MSRPLLPALLLAFFGTLTAPGAPKSPPNLVFIIADDCTYLDMEVYGGQAKTPHLKALAKEGLKFTRCFQSAPMCSPTRHNIYTGLYPVKSGAYPNHTCVYPGTKSIAHYLQDVGYTVHLSGKTHISPKESFPFDYSGEFKSADPAKVNCYPQLDALFTATADAAKTDSPKPFCLFACSNEPHTPYTNGDPSAYPPASLRLPPNWVDTPETRSAYSKYLAEITFFDQQCGTLLALLDHHGLRDNTLVLATSEQGSSFPFAKWTCYELGLTSAMIARWPGKISPATTTDALIEYVDITPTFLEAAGTVVPDSLDGKSFLPVLLGNELEHKQFTFGIQTTRGIINGSEVYGIRSCGTKSHRYIRNLTPEATFSNAVTRTGGSNKNLFWNSWLAKAAAGDAQAKSITTKYQHRPAEELYDVAKDPHCLHNLAANPEYATLKAKLSTQLDQWMLAQGDRGAETEAVAHTRTAKFAKGPKKPRKQKKKPPTS